MKILSTAEISLSAVAGELENARAKSDTGETLRRARVILDDVRSEGDAALFRFAEKLDGVKLTMLSVSGQEMKEAFDELSPSLLNALQAAKKNIEKFHKSTLRRKERIVSPHPGVNVWREFRPIERVGLYVPGGKAAYPSTVLMLAVPAQVAGCQEMILCTPPGKDGRANPLVLAAARLCGLTQIFKVGGAQAIGAMAYGTASIPKVFKIFGPGNAYVTAAKMLVFGEVDIDLPAGPSEVMVLAEEGANPAWVAADLLSQLEHGEDSQSVLVTSSRKLANRVMREIDIQKRSLSRGAIIRASLEKSFCVIVSSLEEAAEIANAYAPEHLEIVTANPSALAKKINNAGSIFLGPYTNEPLGDYATGANHTLPTLGYAKMFPALSTESFGKMIQIQKVSKEGIKKLKFAVETIAEAEGLDAHKNAVAVRFS